LQLARTLKYNVLAIAQKILKIEEKLIEKLQILASTSGEGLTEAELGFGHGLPPGIRIEF